MPNIDGMVIVNPPLKEEDRKRIVETVKKDHIYKMKQDIMDIENLKKTLKLEKKMSK